MFACRECEIQGHTVARIWQKPAKRPERCVGSAIEIIKLVIWDQDGISLRPPSTTALRIVRILPRHSNPDSVPRPHPAPPYRCRFAGLYRQTLAVSVMAPAQEVSARVSPEGRIYAWLPPQSSIVVPKPALSLGLGLDFRCFSSNLAVLSVPSLDSLLELNGLWRRISCTSGHRVGIDDAMRIVLPSTLQGQVRYKRARIEWGRDLHVPDDQVIGVVRM
jgi:hypothetical protein